MRITLNDGRQMTGQMLAFDKVRFAVQRPNPYIGRLTDT
jgi:hypothetical protein